MKKDNYEYINGTSFAGITTPPDQEDMAATDKISEVVQEILDNIQEEFQDGEDGNDTE
ncbi:MAG: hypothetical protein K0S39_2863 [Paenibacillus sp.]|nr:hypothetical protein [Paenibacillus sp.]